MGRETPINWLAIRTDYLAGDTELTALGRKYGVARQSIWRRMESDKKAGRPWLTAQQSITKLLTDRIEGINRSVDAAGEAAGSFIDNLQRHNELETLMLDVAIDSLKRLRPIKLVEGAVEEPLDLPTIQARKSALDAAVKVVESSRLIHGVATEMPSVRITQREEKPTDSGIEIRQRRLEPVKLPVGVDGLKTG